jgi:hypothetical protein
VREILDDLGRFTFGKYRGKIAEYVARNDVGYLKWCVENMDDLSDQEMKILEQLIRRFDR